MLLWWCAHVVLNRAGACSPIKIEKWTNDRMSMMWKSRAFELEPLVETHYSLVVIYQVASLQQHSPALPQAHRVSLSELPLHSRALEGPHRPSGGAYGLTEPPDSS